LRIPWDWTILMRQTQAAEFRLYREFGIEPEEALSLAQGEAFVLTAGRPLERHQFWRRYSPDGAKTPGLAELREHQRGAIGPDLHATRRLPEQQAHLLWSGSSRPLAPASVPGWREQQNTGVSSHLAQNYSPSPQGSPAPACERENPLFTVHPGEAVNAVNGLHGPVNAGESFTGEREAFTPSVNSTQSGFTSEEEVQVLLAYADLLKAGEKVTRTAIRDRLGWNNKQYSRVIMPVCDKHHIG
jgi:hypothetical protein